MIKTPPKPLPLPISSLTIPTALKSLPQWVVWRYEWIEDKEKWTKVPYRAKDPSVKARSNAKATWATFEQALATYQAGEVDGIGFVLTVDLGFVGIDLDHCRDPGSGDLDTWAVDIVQAIASYTEVSPSGTGLRLFTAGTLPAGGRKVGDREIYASGRYLTLTGCHLHDTPRTIEARQPAIDEVYAQYFPTPPPRMVESSNGTGPARTDEEVLALAREARNRGKFIRLWEGDRCGYPSQSEADLALCILLAFWTRDAGQLDTLFRQSGLMRPKWDERHGELNYGDKTITEALSMQTEHYHPPRQRASSSTDEASTPIHLTDVGNGLRLVDQFGEDLRYVTTWKKWLQWQENRWAVDPDGGVEWHVKQVIAGLYAWAHAKIAELGATVGGDDAAQKQRAAEMDRVQACLAWALKSESGTHIDLAVRRARSNPQVRLTHDALDTDPMLL
jgi:putative DNA primase/helicase